MEIKKILKWLWVDTKKLIHDEGGFWQIFAAIAAVLSAITGAYSMYAQAQAQRRMAEYNALIARQNAELATEQMIISQKEKEIAEARHRRKTEKILGAQKAAWAKAGVELAGTPLIVEAETLTEAELDALAIRYAGTVEQSQILAQQAGFRQEEVLQRMGARQYRTAGFLGAGTTLLTGLGQVGYYMGQRK